MLPTCDVSFVSSGHDVADARLHRLCAALDQAGTSVEVLGLGARAQAPSTGRVRTWSRRGLAGRARLAATLPWRAHGRVVVAFDPDVLLAAWPACRLRRRRLVADVHEDYAALIADRPWARGSAGVVARGVVALASTVARHTDATLVADDHVPPRSARRRLVVRNMPEPSLLPALAARDARPRAVYVGDIRRSRGLPMMLDAIEAAPAWTLDLIGPVAPADQAWLRDRLAAPALADRVRLHGRRPPRESWQLATGAWVGFCLLDATPAFVAARASKLYEYLATGLVPVVTDLPQQRDLVERSGSGVVVRDAAAVADALAELDRDPALLDAQVDSGRRWLTGAPGGGYREFVMLMTALARD